MSSSDDDNNNAKNTTQVGQSPPSPNGRPASTGPPQNEDQDLLSTFRRLADEHISAALHSVFGIPSILQTPSSSNWIIDENDRKDGVVNRREGGDSNDDNENNGGSGSSGMSGFGGGSGGSSSSSAGSGSGPGSSNNRDRDDENKLRIPLWTPTISQVLLSLGLHSTALLERNFGHFHKEFQRLLEEEQKNINKVLESPESQTSLEASNKQQFDRTNDHTPKSFSETVIVRGSQTSGDSEPKYTVERYTNGKPSSGGSDELPSIWRELFGEDMHGPQRTHPLFTSFFDEFLPDVKYGREHPPSSTVGGWRMPGSGSRNEDVFPDPFESLVRMMVSPTLRRLQESGDDRYNDGMRRQADQIFRDVMSGKAPRDVDGIVQDFIGGSQHRLTDEQRAEMKRHMEEYRRERERGEAEFREQMEDRKRELMRLMQARQAAKASNQQRVEDLDEKQLTAPLRSEARREPDTELDLHNYFHGLTTAESTQKDGEKLVVSQSTSTTTTTDVNGITRTKRVRERRFSDGSIEREEQNDEAAPPTSGQQSHSKEGWGSWGEYGFPKRIGARSDELRQAFKDERERSELSNSAISKESQNESNEGGGWGSWLWASGRK